MHVTPDNQYLYHHLETLSESNMYLCNVKIPIFHWGSWVGFINFWHHLSRVYLTVPSLFYYKNPLSKTQFSSYTVTRRSAEFRHPARMTQDSSCYIGENDWFIWAGNLRPQVPKFSVITGNFRRWKKEEYAWWDRTQYLWITMPVLYP